MLTRSLYGQVTRMYLSTAQFPPLVLKLSANNVNDGQKLTASCTASDSAVSRVLHIDEQAVTERIPGSRLDSNSDGRTTTWTINPVRPQDAGEYSCVVAPSTLAINSDSAPQNVTVFCEFQVCMHACMQ